MRRSGAEPQLVPGVERRERIGEREFARRAPAGLDHQDGAVALGRLDVLALGAQDGRQPAREVPGALLVAALDVGRQVHVARRLLVELQADQARHPAEFLLRVGRAQKLLQRRQHGAQVFECIGAEGALAPFLGPVRGLELGWLAQSTRGISSLP